MIGDEDEFARLPEAVSTKIKGVYMNSLREQNAQFVAETIRVLVKREDLLPVGQLAVFFHAANGLGVIVLLLENRGSIHS